MEKEVGKVTHFYNKISVGIVALTDTLNVGDTIHVQGRRTDFTQKVESMQIQHESIDSARAGDEIGLKVSEPVREGDVVYKVEEG